ncbi:MAG: GNAT family N-acetyltransferase [Phycisphaerales bacterium]|nr:GNAT family N-acetyltransferase [Phycisphaerales bacterium]
MDVRLINELEDLDGLRAAWESVYAADEHASIFMSWPWMRGWLGVTPRPWAVLAVRRDPASPWLAFLPISVWGMHRRLRFDQVREIHLAGDPAADYAGFLCASEHQQQVLPALARFIAEHLHWDKLRFREVNDPRIDSFLESFPPRTTKAVTLPGPCCPYIELPPTWDQYLQQCLTYETRKSLRKKLRLVERECRVTRMEHACCPQHIEALLELAAHSEYHSQPDTIRQFQGIFQSCAEAGVASIIIVWHGESPIAGIGAFTDAKAQSLDFYLTSFDDRFAQYSPGRVVNALGIQYAIERKMKTLDFLRGDEPYKLQFGAKRRYTRNVTIVRRSVSSKARFAVNRLRRTLHI